MENNFSIEDLQKQEQKVKKFKDMVMSNRKNQTEINLMFLLEEEEKYINMLKEQFVVDDKMELIALLQKQTANLERIAKEKILKAKELEKELNERKQQGGGGNLENYVDTLREANKRLGQLLKEKTKEEERLELELFNKGQELEQEFLEKERKWKLEVAILKNQIEVWKVPDTLIVSKKNKIEDYEQKLRDVENKLKEPQTLGVKEREELVKLRTNIRNNLKKNKEKYEELVQLEMKKKTLLLDEDKVDRDFLEKMRKEEEQEEQRFEPMTELPLKKRDRDTRACILCANPASFKAEVFYCSRNCKNEHCQK